MASQGDVWGCLKNNDFHVFVKPTSCKIVRCGDIFYVVK